MIRVGDVVWNYTVSIKMTVSKVYNCDVIHCCWFSETNTLQLYHNDFSICELVLYTKYIRELKLKSLLYESLTRKSI